MGLAEYRKTRGISQEAAAAELGLASKGYFSRLETGRAPWPIKLALAVEVWSQGHILALSLISDEDAALLRAAIERAYPECVA